MPWTVGTFHKKHWSHSALLWICVAIAASLGLLALPRAQRGYDRWRENRRVARGAAALAAGEYPEAIVHAKAALALDPHGVEATRIIAQALEAMHAPQALTVRRRLDSLTASDVENTLAIAAGSWKAGDAVAAERALQDLPPAARDSARYHELAARVAATHRDISAALTHWQEALRHEPANEEYALELATTRLKSKAPGDRAAALQQLDQLATKPGTRLAALRALLSDGGTRGERSRTLELSTAVISDPAATFADRLQHLGILRTTRAAGFAPFLAQLQETSVADPKQLYALLAWMNQHDLALLIPEWVAKLPPESRAVPQVRAAVADAQARASDWAGLKERLESESWGELEFLRLAHLSRALEHLGDENGAVAAWANAVGGALASSQRLEILGKTVLEWGWNRKGEEVLWKLAASETCPRWAADFLWSAALKDGDSARLYEAARVILKADPKSVPARNNFVTLSLLTGHDQDSPLKMAEALYRQQPTDPFVATTYGFSLYQQGRAAEAAQMMTAFTPEQLHQPLVALYHGIFLAGAGRFEEAQEYLAAGASAPMRPEEKALFAKARGPAPTAPTGALDRTRRDTAQLYAESRQAFLADPKNVLARGNYLLLALLTGQSVDSARQLARVLYKEQPGDATAACIHGLSLHQQGKADEAVKLLETLHPEQLREPLVALYYGCFLAGSDQAAKAAPFFDLADTVPLLPEERALLAAGKSKGTKITVPAP